MTLRHRVIAYLRSRLAKERLPLRLVFWGGGCNTRVMQFGTPSDVSAEAQEAIRYLAPGGGYIFASIHNIQPMVPPENIVALLQTARTHGRYPIHVD